MKPTTSNQRTGVLIAVLLFAACGDEGPAEAGGPAAPEPSSDPVSERALPLGTFDVSLSACEHCSPGDVPDYLVAFAGGVEGAVEIVRAEDLVATIRLVEMRAAGDGADLLPWFAESTIRLTWDGPDTVYRGSINYGVAAEFIPGFRRVGDSVACDFELFHLKHDVGPTTCQASR